MPCDDAGKPWGRCLLKMPNTPSAGPSHRDALGHNGLLDFISMLLTGYIAGCIQPRKNT